MLTNNGLVWCRILNFETKVKQPKIFTGVVAHYFKPRWQLFISGLISSLEAGQKDFDQNTFNQQVFANVEVPFTLDKTKFLAEPQGAIIKFFVKVILFQHF
jgi:Alpha-N-acetylglucosaminidase (NAGLU) C-terminal domain